MIYEPFVEFQLHDRVVWRGRVGTVTSTNYHCTQVNFDNGWFSGTRILNSALCHALAGETTPKSFVTYHHKRSDPSCWFGEQYSGRAGLGQG